MSLEISNSSLSNFTAALNEYQRATKKDCAVILNKAALNVAYRAAQFTPVAMAAAIKSKLYRDPHLLAALTSISLKKRGIGTLPKGQFKSEMDAFAARRIGSRRYLRSGWARAIIDMGGTFRGSKLKRGDSGFAEKATPDNLLSLLAWIIEEPTTSHADSAEDVGIKALEEAINFVARDMITYAQEKLAKTAAQYSA